MQPRFKKFMLLEAEFARRQKKIIAQEKESQKQLGIIQQQIDNHKIDPEKLKKVREMRFIDASVSLPDSSADKTTLDEFYECKTMNADSLACFFQGTPKATIDSIRDSQRIIDGTSKKPIDDETFDTLRVLAVATFIPR